MKYVKLSQYCGCKINWHNTLNTIVLISREVQIFLAPAQINEEKKYVTIWLI